MILENEISFEWKEPEEVERFVTRSLRICGLTIIPFILLYVFLFFFAEDVFLIVDPDPGDGPDSWGFEIVFLIVCLFFYISVFKLFPRRVQIFDSNFELICSGQFRIDKDNIISSMRLPFYPLNWKVCISKIRGYSLSQHDVFLDIQVINLHFGKHRKKTLVLPKDETAESIKDYFASNFEKLEDTGNVLEAHLTKYQYVFLYIFVFVYALIMSVLQYHMIIPLPVMLTLTILLGPGTIGLFAILRRRFFMSRNSSFLLYAFLLNMSVPSVAFTFVCCYLTFFVF